MKMKYLIGILAIGVVMASCKKKQDDPSPPVEPVENYIRVDVNPFFGADMLYLDSVYSFGNGDLIKFDEIKFYLQDIRNGSNLMVEAGLFDYRARGKKLLEVKGEYSYFNTIDANLGVDSATNHMDPSGFPTSSMLNIMNSNDMHWGWNPGYIFVKVEAKMDTIPNATELFDHTIVYHVGLDANLMQVNFTNATWNAIGNNTHALDLKLDMEAFFAGPTPIDYMTEYTSHAAAGQEIITAKVMNNFKNALTLY